MRSTVLLTEKRGGGFDNLFTIVTVNVVDVYVYRLTGGIDGAGRLC
jgi:hypothetical protein